MIEHHFHFDELLPPLLGGFENKRFQPAISGRDQHVPSILGAEDHVISAAMRDISLGFDLAQHRTNVLQTRRFVKGI